MDLFEADVNYLAVALAGLAAQPLGFIWYSQLFGRRWMAARGYSEEDVRADARSILYLVPLLAALVIAYGFARLCDMVGADSIGDSIAVAAFVWVSFTATVQAMQINFTPNAPDKVAVFGIEGGFQLASFVLIGAIIGAFQ